MKKFRLNIFSSVTYFFKTFFTHALRDEQTTKFVLHGFYAIEVTELAGALDEMGFKPLSVKNISVHNKRYEDHAVYIVHFLKSDKMQIATLRENVGVINSVRVRWKFFQNKRKGPIQCSRCM